MFKAGRHYVDVLRVPGRDCTNGGLTSRHTCAMLLTDPADDGRDISAAVAVLRVVRRTLQGSVYVHAEPVDKGSRWPMAGGNFVYSHDSRFRSEVCAYPISVHDRFES